MNETILEVGQLLSIESHYRAYVTTHVLGWEKDVFLLTRAIYGRDQAAQLKSRDFCKVRFLRDGVAYGFETVVLSVQSMPSPVMFLRYPAHVERVEIRRAPRCKLGVPAQLLDAAGREITGAVVSDVSELGCLLELPVLQEHQLPVDAVYTVSFAVVEKVFSIGCAIRKLEKGEDGWSVGLQFTGLTGPDREALAKVIDFVRRSTFG